MSKNVQQKSYTVEYSRLKNWCSSQYPPLKINDLVLDNGQKMPIGKGREIWARTALRELRDKRNTEEKNFKTTLKPFDMLVSRIHLVEEKLNVGVNVDSVAVEIECDSDGRFKLAVLCCFDLQTRSYWTDCFLVTQLQHLSHFLERVKKVFIFQSKVDSRVVRQSGFQGEIIDVFDLQEYACSVGLRLMIRHLFKEHLYDIDHKGRIKSNMKQRWNGKKPLECTLFQEVQFMTMNAVAIMRLAFYFQTKSAAVGEMKTQHQYESFFFSFF
jgi:hypothetical protein